MSRTRYYAFRTVHTVFLLWLILSLLFFFFRFIPGGYTTILTQQGVTQETVEAFKSQWGLDQPLHIQYVTFLKGYLTLELGNSFQYNTSVWDFVKMRIFNSFILVAPGITLGYILGSIIGTVFGTNRDSRLEKWGLVPIIFVGAIPIFFTGIVFIIVFAQWFDLFPTGGIIDVTLLRSLEGEPWWRMYLTKSFALHYILPFSVIVLRYIYNPTLIMRTSVVEVLGQGFAYFQRVTGLPKIRRMKHIAKHASLPVITLYPVSMTRAIGGLVLLETVFNWPGIGYTLVEAVLVRDLPVVQFVFFLVAAFVVLGNYVVDIVYGYIDPRIIVGD